MRTIEYRTKDKTEWGDGPWQGEPDKVQFEDPETGLPCLIVRNRFGALCGYVGVTSDHPLYGHDWDGTGDLDVHGGITYGGVCQTGGDPLTREAEAICHRVEDGEDDNVWWLGFDCGHYMDLQPGYPDELIWEGSVYRTVEYVRGEIAGLAKQLTTIS